MKAIIFDADGTLTPQRTGSCGTWERALLPGVAEKCAELRAEGVVLAIASNQSAQRDVEDIEAQLAWTAAQIGADIVLYATDTARRKPSPAMLLEAMALAGASRGETLFIGDQVADEQAANAAGVAFCYACEFFEQPEPVSGLLFTARATRRNGSDGEERA